MANEKVTGDRLSTERVQILENLHSNLARMLASSFSTMQRSVVDCDIKFVDQTTYGEFIATLSNPSCSYTFTIDPFGGTAILDFSLPVAYSFIDRHYGGSGGNPPSHARPLTRLERTVTNNVLRNSLVDLEATWEALLKVRVTDAELETNPEFMQVADSAATVLLVAFEVHSQHASGLVQLCYPFDTLAPAVKYLSLAEAPRSHREQPASLESEPEPPVNASGIATGRTLEQIATDRPDVVAGVLEALLTSDDGAKGPRNAAVIIACLPRNVASKVIRQCSADATGHLEGAVGKLGAVTAADSEEVFAHVKDRLSRGDYNIPGAAESAQLAMKEATRSSSGFYLLRNVDPNQIIPFVSKEHPQTIALFLSQLDACQAAGVLNGLSSELRADVSYRIAHMESVSPQTLRGLEDDLVCDLQRVLSGQVTEVGGPKAVAAILNRAGRSTEEDVLERLGKQDSELAEDVRNQMFVFDDIAKLTDREIQVILRAVDSKDLAVSLKGACEELKERVFANLSEEVGDKIKEEMEFAAPIRMSDVEEVQLNIVKMVRQLDKDGEVKIVRGDSRDKFV